MSRIVSIHSFRGSTGKSNTSANLSYLLADAGRVVGVIDTDIQSPGIHVLLGETEHKGSTLNDYLFGKVTIDQVAVDVSDNVGLPAGRLHLIPSSMELMQISRILKEGYDVGLLNQGFKDLVRNLAGC